MTAHGVRTVPAAAPGRLSVVQAFMNTVNVEKGTDELDNAGSAAAWLTEYPGVDLKPTRTGLDRLAALRTTLRTMCEDPESPAAWFADHDTVLSVRADADGRLVLHPRGSAIDRVLGELTVIVLEAQRDGTWPRLRICGNDACRWAFYDTSRSRTGRWCAMGICGNRTKVAAYRRRTENR